MKRRPLIALTVFAFAGATWLCWIFFKQSPEAATPHAVTRPSAPTQKRITNNQPAEHADPWPEFGTPEFKMMALERGKKWLESRGRDAASLVAMWDVSGDEALLLEAAERFPNDPRVCLGMIQHAGKDGTAALPWIERLIAAEPGNPNGHYLKVSALMQLKDSAGALVALRAAAALKGTLDDHLRDRILTVREAALASGTGIREASALALVAPLTHTTAFQTFSGTMRVLRAEIVAAKAAGDQDRLVETAGLGMAVVAHANGGTSRYLVDELVGLTLEKAVLSELPGDTEFGIAGRTVSEQREDIELRRARMQEDLGQSNAATVTLSDASDAVDAEYTDRFLLHGERAARTWLLEQFPPAK